MARPNDYQTGQTIGERYHLEGILGAGGFGTVFRARQAPLDRPVAVKVCHSPAADTKAYERFELEARIIAALRSPHTVRLYDFGLTAESFPYFAMELITGHTLAQEIQLGPLAPARAARILIEICESLAEAHARDVVHLDLKPSNVMLERISGRGEMARVLDFGIALMKTDVRPGAGGRGSTILGTPRYMAPEMFSQEGVTASADVFGIGLVLDECLRGAPTFKMADEPAFFGRHFETLPPAPEGTPPGLAEIRDSLLALDPGDRPPSAEYVRELLMRWCRMRDQRRLPDQMNLRGTRIETPATATTDEFDSSSFSKTRLLDHIAPQTVVESAGPVNLPVHSSRFVGRAAELAAIAEAFGPGGHRLVTLLGTGGAGKSRLSIRFGHEVQRQYPGGVWFCDLLEATTVAGIAVAVASAFETPLGASEPVSLLGNMFANSDRILVILDNFEQVCQYAKDTVGRWLQRAPNVHFVVTSRSPLALSSEHIIRVDPFDLEDAVALFGEHGSLAAPGFTVTPANRHRIEAVVESLDCLPLAIELAAARMNTFTLEQLEARLEERFRVLRARQGSKPAHQMNMRSAIDWSWAILTAVEQLTLAQCSVFRGGFSLVAAETVLDLGGLDEGLWTDEVIAALVDKSLIRRWAPSDGVLRFGLYESIRAFAAEKMSDPLAVVDAGGRGLTGEEPLRLLRRRHACKYGELGHPDALARQYRHGGLDFFDELRREQENVYAALHAAIMLDEQTLATHCAFGIGVLAANVGPVQMGQDALALVSGYTDLDPFLQIELAARVGGLRSKTGDRRGAREHWRHALAICGDDVSHPRYANLLMLLGMVESTLGDHVRGRSLLVRALSHAQREVGRWSEATCLGNFAIFLQHHSEMPRASACYDRALEMYREMGDVYGELAVLCSLGTFYDDLGDPVEAEKVYLQGYEMAQRCGDKMREAGVLANLGLLCRVNGRFAESMRYSQAAVELARKSGNLLAIAIGRGNLGDLYYEMGDLQRARVCLENALIQCDETEPYAAGAFRGSLALICAEEGDFEAAEQHFMTADGQLRATHAGELGKMLCKKGQVAMMQGRVADARALHAEATEIGQDLGAGAQSELGLALSHLQERLNG